MAFYLFTKYENGVVECQLDNGFVTHTFNSLKYAKLYENVIENINFWLSLIFGASHDYSSHNLLRGTLATDVQLFVHFYTQNLSLHLLIECKCFSIWQGGPEKCSSKLAMAFFCCDAQPMLWLVHIVGQVGSVCVVIVKVRLGAKCETYGKV